ncbi:ATP-binding protein [Actimicrobium sp. CCC2.4]|uniref:hybrid sensor histidine kinase/response regulator n=1 Tax=Actimicrobium sp. CCC2.4 TaxID=3048606 RepID=UPI002AC9EBE5|nr:ATP-binding protein [Actimicrobium sp. CCC2.4]MEB0133736.1 ATP-binding protein [Actimicrobium sp. CCC2.4]WPX31282.1 ATP-binding protein [Actimicrobium sp. CCC2.4]
MTQSLTPRKSSSARHATAIIGSLLIILLVAATVASSWVLRDRAIEDWRRDLGNLSLVMAENTSQTMASAYLVLDSIGELVENTSISNQAELIKTFHNAATYQMMRDKVSGLPQIDVVTIVGANGDVINFTRAFPAPAINLANRDYFAHHRDNVDPAVFLSTPVKNKGNGKWTFYISRRVNSNEGQFLGMVRVGISCDFFADFFKNVSLGEEASVSLLRRDYTLLARWPDADKLMGNRNLLGATHTVLEAGKTHDVILTNAPRPIDGMQQTPRMGAVRLVRGYPLAVNITITEDLYLSSWRSTVRLLGGIGLVSLLALCGAFILMAIILKRRELDAEQALTLKREAEEANTAKSSFLAMMSHEIRTPMNGILGMAELMLDTPLDASQRTYAGNVYNGAHHLMRIINEILDFSKVESGHMEIDLTTFDPTRLIGEVIGLHRNGATAKQLQIRTEIAPAAALLVSADASRIRQVLGNLINNAIKFTPAGAITVRFVGLPDPADATLVQLEYSVTDSGIGISAEAQQRLFEPFVQADNTISRKYGGTGLGLAICKRLVELMRGDIRCESDIGAGTRFSFRIPARVIEQPVIITSPPVPVTAAVPSQENSVQALRVLVVEDTEMNRQLVRILLGKRGCIVEEAVNGQLALEALAMKQYDLVLMDCMMPVMDGYEATRRLREREAANGAARMPVIALTASAIEGDRERCLDAGMDDYLAKPFSAAQLTTIIEKWRKAG